MPYRIWSRALCLSFFGRVRQQAEIAADKLSPKSDQSTPKRKPFANWVKRIANFKGGDEQKAAKKNKAASKHKKSNTSNGNAKNNPYPESGPLRQRNHSPATSNGELSFVTPASRPQDDDESYGSVPNSRLGDGPGHSNKSGAPTLATNADTTHSDAGQSKAATSTTRGGALSSTDGAGANSTFSSPNPSERSSPLHSPPYNLSRPATRYRMASPATKPHTTMACSTIRMATSCSATNIPPHLRPPT